MKLLLKNERHLIERWKNALHNRVPGLEVVTFPLSVIPQRSTLRWSGSRHRGCSPPWKICGW